MTEGNDSAQPVETPAPETGAATNSKRGLIIGLSVVIALLLCVGVIAGFAIPARREAERQEQLKAQAAAFEKAEAAYQVAERELDAASKDMTINAVWSKVEQAQTNADLVVKRAKAAREQIEVARGQIALLPESKGKQEFSEALDLLSSSADGFEKASPELPNIFKVHVLVQKGDVAFTQGEDYLEQSVEAGNNQKYRSVLAPAEKALKSFKNAQALYQQAQDARPGSGTSQLVKETAKMVKIATLQVQMGKYGKSGNVNGYNDTIDKIEAAEKTLWGPDDLSDWSTGAVKVVTGTAVTSLENAKKLHTTAAARLEE